MFKYISLCFHLCCFPSSYPGIAIHLLIRLCFHLSICQELIGSAFPHSDQILLRSQGFLSRFLSAFQRIYCLVCSQREKCRALILFKCYVLLTVFLLTYMAMHSLVINSILHMHRGTHPTFICKMVPGMVSFKL